MAICRTNGRYKTTEPWGGDRVIRLGQGVGDNGDNDPGSQLLILPHRIHAGPATGTEPARPTWRLAVPLDIPFAAILEYPNVFTDVNTVHALRLSRKTVTEDYQVTILDAIILADATDGPITITLFAAVGTVQLIRVKKIDATSNPVQVVVAPDPATDTINAASEIILTLPNDGCALIDVEPGLWDNWTSPTGSPGVDLSDVAFKSQINVFTKLNVFKGLRIAERVVTSDTILTEDDFEVSADCTDGPITLTLPVSAGNGQVYHITKIDDTDEILTIAVDGGSSDLIDGSISLNLSDQYADALLSANKTDSWRNWGPTTGDSGDDIFYIGEDARFVGVNGGLTLECRPHGTTDWREQWSQIET